MSDRVAGWRRRARAVHLPFLVLLAAAAICRVQFASTADYIHDEENTTIPLATLISFDPGNRNLPIRAVNHPALPAYFVHIGSAVAGATPLGYRAAHIAIGLLTLTLVYATAREAYGAGAALWAAALLAFNEYYLVVSARATAHAPYLLFVALAVFLWCRFLATQRPAYLYATATAVAFGFYCKEHIVLILPIFLATLAWPPHRRWLRSLHPYAAVVLFAIFIGPDLAWNAGADPSVDRVTYGNRDVAQATYARHLQRIGGVAFSPYPLVFYGRSAVIPAWSAATGSELDDNTAEYHAMNPAIGVVLLAAVALVLWRRRPHPPVQRFLLLYFCAVFVLFSAIRRGNPEGLDSVSWIWVDATMVPAAILAGSVLATEEGVPVRALRALAAAALVYACASVLSTAG